MDHKKLSYTVKAKNTCKEKFLYFLNNTVSINTENILLYNSKITTLFLKILSQ